MFQRGGKDLLKRGSSLHFGNAYKSLSVHVDFDDDKGVSVTCTPIRSCRILRSDVNKATCLEMSRLRT